MPSLAPHKGLAIASLGLGFLGLLTAGGCGVGALVGLALGAGALLRDDPAHDSGRDVAWAGIVTNTLSLLTIGPVMILVVLLNGMGALPSVGGEQELPEVHSPAGRDTLPMPPPPPAPGPASPTAGTPASREALRVGGAIREPRKLRHVSPVYPEIAKQARVQGLVILEATISPAGKVSEVRVLRGVPLLDRAAVDAVKQWEYSPTLLNGEPVPVIMTVTVNFRLQ